MILNGLPKSKTQNGPPKSKTQCGRPKSKTQCGRPKSKTQCGRPKSKTQCGRPKTKSWRFIDFRGVAFDVIDFMPRSRRQTQHPRTQNLNAVYKYIIYIYINISGVNVCAWHFLDLASVTQLLERRNARKTNENQ